MLPVCSEKPWTMMPGQWDALSETLWIPPGLLRLQVMWAFRTINGTHLGAFGWEERVLRIKASESEAALAVSWEISLFGAATGA